MTTTTQMGIRIKRLRELNKLSQTELAERVGYKDKTAVAKVEAGKVDLPQSKITAFAKALNTTTSYLFGDDDIATSDTEETGYYLNEQSAEMAQFLFDNPEYKVLFDASRKVKPEDIQFVADMIKRVSNDD